MSVLAFRQHFGPSPRHDRACVEVGFPVAEGTVRLAPLEPLLIDAGYKLYEPLPAAPLAFEHAVACLAESLLARHGRWWSDHGREGERGWAALSHPYPAAAALALELAFALVNRKGALPPGASARLLSLSKRLAQVSKIKMFMLSAAETCGHDVTIVNEMGDVHQVGQGARGVHLCRGGSERDSLTGVRLESDKQKTADTLRKLGLPSTEGDIAKTAEQAVAIARKVGLPCVVKPVALSRGTGVAAGLTSEAAVVEAANAALALGHPIRVEKHVDGDTHRLLVCNGELLWVYRKRAARVTGDGNATIAELIDRENARRARIRNRAESHLVHIELDDGLRRYIRIRHGLTPDAILPRGKTIEVSGQANTASGGTLEDMIGDTHPDNRSLAIRVARLFRMNVIGIDFMTPDISRSWKDIPSAILEVNRMPSMNNAGDATILQRTLFPNRLSAHVPTVAVIGDEAFRATHAEALRTAFAHQGLRFAAAEYRAASGSSPLVFGTRPPEVEALMLDPEADAIAVLCDPEMVESAGLPVRRCDWLIRQDKAPLPWLDRLAETVMRGEPAQARIDLAAARLARRFGDPAEGGAVPALEPVESAPGEFRLKVWRTRGVPRSWFWDEIGVTPPRADGLTTCADLLQAVVSLAPGLEAEFAHDPLPGGWALVHFEAVLPLPDTGHEEMREALLGAVAKVNAVAAKRAP